MTVEVLQFWKQQHARISIGDFLLLVGFGLGSAKV